MNWWVRRTKRFDDFKSYWKVTFSTSAVTGCVSISAFPSLVGIPVYITSSAVGLKICAITAGIKKYKPIIK